MNIDTGGSYNYSGGHVDASSNPRTSSNVIFDPSSTYSTSTPVNVYSGSQILVTAYNLEDGARIIVHGASLGEVPISSGTVCCTEGKALSLHRYRSVDVLFRAPMRLGGNLWELTPTNNRLLIAVPGSYLFELNDPSYFGNLQVEYQVFPYEHFPDVYYAGVVAAG